MIQIISWIWVFSGVLLILLVLLHSPKGDGMGGIAASGSSMFNSASSAEAPQTRLKYIKVFKQ
jgi:preprotein translocase subunit SecG